MGTKCLIIAAGKGSRMRAEGESKPLIPILGLPLIERVIRTTMEAGVDEFFVVVGYRGDQVSDFLGRLSEKLTIPITSFTNDEWDKENGLSVLKARDVIQEPFLLLMADHLFDPNMVRTVIAHKLANEDIALAVDKDTQNSLVDMEDVTRVKVEDGNIRDIGKGLVDFNGFDTGIFMCSPAIFKALEQSREEDGETSLTAAVLTLAAEGRAKAIPVSGFWIDVDDRAAFKKAERAMLARLSEKTNDGPVSRFLNRPVSTRISRQLAKYNISPNQISIVSFLTSMVAAGFFASGTYLALLLGGVLAQFASILDGSDGEVARLKYQGSDFGGWFDAVLDRYADAFLLFGLTWYLLAEKASGWILFIGFMAIIGSFMLSYTADKYDNLMRERIKSRFRMGRDVRVFLIFIGAVLNLVLPVLVIIAVVMNVETIRRVKIAYAD